MARNRHSWQKRAKEMARKEKNVEKMKRRQGKTLKPPAEETPTAAEPPVSEAPDQARRP